MHVRLLELHRVLKPTGSIYLHCDPTASHYLKILLDSIFGKSQFQNEVIWSYRRWPTKARRYQRMHDVILFYSKGSEVGVFNTLYQEASLSSQKRWKGKKQNVTFDPTGKRNPTEEIDESSAVPLNSVWQIPLIAPVASERLGYPTQKPLALLERIISASSNEGDVVLDPFCGCGTTVHAAQKLNRQWIGIDVTHLAISLIENRLRAAFPTVSFEVVGTPKDLASARDLAHRDKYQFQWWAVSLVNALPFSDKKKGSDKGIDGYIYFKPDGKTTERAIVSVKGGEKVSSPMIRDLKGVMDREKAPIGIFISLAEPTRDMISEAASAGVFEQTGEQVFSRSAEKFPRIQIFTIADLFEGKRPKIPYSYSEGYKKAAREEGKQDRLL